MTINLVQRAVRSKPQSLEKKVCVVTGAGSGIGRTLAQELSRRGARLALSDVNEAGLEETARTLHRAEVHSEQLDVSNREAFAAYAAAVATHFGVVHQIYNNAGITTRRSVLDSQWSDYDRVLGVDLWGVLYGSKAFLPHLIASGDGHIVNISSLNGIMAQPDMSHYCLSKFAVRGFTESLRAELARDGHPVHTTLVHPGGIRTNIATAALDSARTLGMPITAADEKREKFYNEKLLKMDAAKAALIIVDGVAARRPRILVGTDAKLMDALVRLIPSQYPRVVLAGERRLDR